MSTTIFAQTRPIRTAYLVDAERFSGSSLAIDALIDSFVGHANLVWGGRCDPLIYGPLRTELPPADIPTLRKYDPDRVHVLGTIGDDLLKQLDAELSLWEVTEEEALKPERIGTDLVEAARKVPISVPAAPIMPSNTNLARAPSNRLLMFRSGQLTQKAPELRIRIPDDFSAVCTMLREPMTGGRLGGLDLRARLPRESSIVGVEISSEGKQLQELVTLIGALWRADRYFGKRLWRDLFTRMAGKDARREENLRTEVSNSIWKGFENELTAEKLERLVPPTTE